MDMEAARAQVARALKRAQENRLAFSWIASRRVCQHWAAHYAAVPGNKNAV